MLLREVKPIIAASLARGVVKSVGAEDLKELEADALAQAANMIESAEKAGKTVSASSVAFYTLQALRSGRRFGCASRTDAMSVAAQLDGKCVLLSLDEPLDVFDEDDDEEFNLHQCLASTGEDPAMAGARELDWDGAVAGLADGERELLLETAAGTPGIDLAYRYNVTPARVTQRKRGLGDKLRSALGEEVMVDCVREPGWEGYMRAYRERRACRLTRRGAE
jgi:hypothetical protein